MAGAAMRAFTAMPAFLGMKYLEKDLALLNLL